MTTEEARKNPEVIELKKYKKPEGTGVNQYAILEDGIILTFKGKEEYYPYNFKKPGKNKAEEMKQLAGKGNGLSSYINRYMKDNYFEKCIPQSIAVD